MERTNHQNIDLSTRLSFKSSIRFPIQSKESQREVFIGGLWLLVPGIGWLLNMGHRIQMVHNMLHGKPAWPAWQNYPALLRHGTITFLGMFFYLLPAVICLWFYRINGSIYLALTGFVFALCAVVAIPGYMSHYCVAFDMREIFNPWLACKRVVQGGRHYWHAWGIVVVLLAMSFLGLLALGIGFLFTSVWFWQSAGFSFATVMSQHHKLGIGKTAIK